MNFILSTREFSYRWLDVAVFFLCIIIYIHRHYFRLCNKCEYNFWCVVSQLMNFVYSNRTLFRLVIRIPLSHPKIISLWYTFKNTIWIHNFVVSKWNFNTPFFRVTFFFSPMCGHFQPNWIYYCWRFDRWEGVFTLVSIKVE